MKPLLYSLSGSLVPCRGKVLPAAASGDGEIGVLSQRWRLEGEDDMVLWNTTLDQDFRDAIGSAVVLNQDFPVSNIYMDGRSVNSLVAVPTRTNHLVMVVFQVDDRFTLDVAV
jgi:hypothetical protein